MHARTLQSDLPSWTFANPLPAPVGDTFSAGGMDTDTVSNDIEQIYCGGQEELPRLGLHQERYCRYGRALQLFPKANMTQ